MGRYLRMYREHFIEAEGRLRKQGLNPKLLRRGDPLSEADIQAVDQRTDRPMPTELRNFYLEMGDGFEFVPDDIPDSPLDGWEPNWLSD